MTGLHPVSKKRPGRPDKHYVYAWRGGPCIYTCEGDKPVITRELIVKAEAARMARTSDYEDSFEAMIDQYLDSPEYLRLAKVTRDDYRRWLTRISERFGSAPIEALDDHRMRKDILSWRDTWAEQPRAADRALGTMSVILGWAKQRGTLRDNIALGLGTLHRVDHSDDIWEERHWKAVADVPAHIMRVLTLGKLTGARLGDLLNLQWAHVGKHAIVMRTAKNKVRVAVPLYDDLRAFLAQIDRTDGAILLNSKDKAWTASGFKSSWATARPEGFDRRFHDLRGTCATWLAGIGLTDTEIAGIIGWKPGRVAEIRARYVSHERTVVALAERMNRK